MPKPVPKPKPKPKPVPQKDLLQGSLDLLLLRTLALGPNHGCGIANRIRQTSADGLA